MQTQKYVLYIVGFCDENIWQSKLEFIYSNNQCYLLKAIIGTEL